MKKIAICLMIMLCGMAHGTESFEEIEKRHLENEAKLHAALTEAETPSGGEYLQRASNCYLISMVLGVAGTLLVYKGEPKLAAGSFLGAVGVTFIGHISLGLAGKKFQLIGH